MSPRRAGAAVLGGAALALALAPAALGASRTLTLEGWVPRALAFSDRNLVWSEAATVRVDPRRTAGSPAGAYPFDYYRAEGFRARLDRRSLRFTAPAQTLVSVRTSIAAMTRGAFAPLPAGGLVMAPYSLRFAAPVVACCTAEGEEIVIESDGRPEALPTVAAAWDGSAVRYVQLTPDGRQVLRRQDAAATAPAAAVTRAGLVALAPDRRAWVDPAAPAVLQVQDDRVVGSTPRAVALPGTALGVWASRGLVAVAVRIGPRVAVLRVGGGPAVRVWSGARVPRVATGGGAVAVADVRRVWASRRGALRLAVRARRPIDAVAVDGRRLAWVERGLRRGARVGVVRLGTTP